MKLLGVDKILPITREIIQKGIIIVPRPVLGEHQHLRSAAVTLRIAG